MKSPTRVIQESTKQSTALISDIQASTSAANTSAQELKTKDENKNKAIDNVVQMLVTYEDVTRKMNVCADRQKESEERIKNLETEKVNFKAQIEDFKVQIEDLNAQIEGLNARISQNENTIKEEQEAIKNEDQTLLSNVKEELLVLLDENVA